MKEYVDKLEASQNMVEAYDDHEYDRAQYNFNVAPEPEVATRGDIASLRSMIAGLSTNASTSARQPLPSQAQQFVQHEEESQVKRMQLEQAKTNRLMEQMLEAMQDQKHRQLLTTRGGANSYEEDFQDDR
jgi:hypothetical protein